MKTVVVIPAITSGAFEVELRIPRTCGEEVVMQPVFVHVPALPSEPEGVSPILVSRVMESVDSIRD